MGERIGSPSYRYMPRQNARHKPGTPIYYLQHFSGVHDFKRLHERQEFTLFEQMSVGCGPTTERTLLFEKRLSEQVTTDFDSPEKRRHARTVQVVEHHDHVKRTGRRWVALQIEVIPMDPAAVSTRRFLGAPQFVGIRIDGDDSRATFGCRSSVTSPATRKIEDVYSVDEQSAMPRKPGAHSREF